MSKNYSSWDKPATAFKFSKSKYTTPSKNWQEVPWAELNQECIDAQEEAVSTYMAELEQSYENHIRSLEDRWSTLHPEEGSYEGNIRDEHPMQMPDRLTLFNIERLASNKAVESFIDSHGIKGYALNILPDIIKYISTFRLTTKAGEDYDPKLADTPEGKISANALCRAYFSSPSMKGLYNFLMLDSRSLYLETQYKIPSKSYSALVPLIMYAFKLHHGIPYSHWSEIISIVNPKLFHAMNFKHKVELTKDEILEARDAGLMTQSGASKGKLRNPVTTYKLYGKNILSDLPEYLQVMITQIWVAHPENRTKYMVLDHLNWDSIPPALVSTNPVAEYIPNKVDVNADMPW